MNLTVVYTLKNQLILALGPQLYLGGETWRLTGGLEAVFFPDRLYPVGDESPDQTEDYGQRLFASSVGAERRLVGQLRLGGGLRVAHAAITRVESGGLLDRGAIPGSDGGFLVGVGPSIAWDDRDKDSATHRGGRHELSLVFFPEFLGSDYSLTQAIVQLRQFFPLWRQHILAVELHAQFSRGDVPFQAMATLGGDNRMRGYFSGRYRDLHSVVGQVEYRMPVWWRIGAVGFVAAGNVANEVSQIRLDDPKVAGGLGLRLTLSKQERVNVRVDVAVTRDGGVSPYVSLGEAF